MNTRHHKKCKQQQTACTHIIAESTDLHFKCFYFW